MPRYEGTIVLRAGDEDGTDPRPYVECVDDGIGTIDALVDKLARTGKLGQGMATINRR